MHRHVTIAMVVVGAFVVAACNDRTESASTPVTSTSVAAPDTTEAAPDASMPADQLARRFINAYAAFDTERALTYLTDDALATGTGLSGEAWGSEDEFRMESALAQAQGAKQVVKDCKSRGKSSGGTNVRCAFDSHLYRSDEVGRGPFGDNYWDIVVRDGKITSATATGAYATNGLSNEMWTPLQTWITRNHPEDLLVMYLGGGSAITDESIRLWEARTR